MSDSLEIWYVPLGELEPAERNPRTHDRPAIRRSMRRYGVRDPLEVDERTGRLAAGHGRAEVLAEMRDRGEDPPRHVRTTDAGEWLVPVVVGARSADGAEAEGYLLASNLTTERGGWDRSGLAAVVADLPEDHAEVALEPSQLEELAQLDPAPPVGAPGPLPEEEAAGQFDALARSEGNIVHRTFNVSKDKVDLVDEVLRSFGTGTQGEQLVALCEAYRDLG